MVYPRWPRGTCFAWGPSRNRREGSMPKGTGPLLYGKRSGPGADRHQANQSAYPIFKQDTKEMGSELPRETVLQIDLTEHKGAHLAGLKGLTPEYRVEKEAVTTTLPDVVWGWSQSRSLDHLAGSMVQGQQEA
jgi:hypothetical protein